MKNLSSPYVRNMQLSDLSVECSTMPDPAELPEMPQINMTV